MEQAVEDHLNTSGNIDLLQNYRDARKQIAVANTYGDAIIQGSNDIDPSVLAREFQKGGHQYMTDNMRDIAAFSNIYKEAMKTQSQVGSKTGTSLKQDVLVSGAKDLKGAAWRTLLSHYPKKIAQKLLRLICIRKLLSRKKLLSPPCFLNSRQPNHQ